MKTITILGTRPEIIRLSRIIPKLDKHSDHKLINTGQNFENKLNKNFFQELGIRDPDVIINSNGLSFAKQLSKIYIGVEESIKAFEPEKILILGDTNSGLSAIIAERLGIPVYHMEAGNRCFDLKVPEEKNRKIIDHISTYNLPYTPSARENLIKEGIKKQNIFQSGNPINEVINFYSDHIERSNILDRLSLKKDDYILVTAHRAENVDIDIRLRNIFNALNKLASQLKVIVSCHPRTKEKLAQFKITNKNPNLIMSEPFGFFDFVKLEKNSKLIITDSGTCQEEACLFNIPSVTIRDTTERPETVECGSNTISGLETENILSCCRFMLDISTSWDYPIGYKDKDVSDKVVNYILSSRI